MDPFYLTSHLFAYTIGPSPIYGHYVYEWLDSGTCFYVGSGTNRRAWNRHNEEAEYIRHNSLNFKVRILQHHLSKLLAHSQERRLTQQRIRQGFILTNIRKPNGI